MSNNILIMGDSYSTYEGYIPEGYRTYYSPNGRGPEQPVTKMRVEDTWWMRFIRATGARLVLNNSWSGSTVCYTGYEGDCSHTSSFIYRYRCLREQGFFEHNRIDTVFVFGGTNDSWSGAPRGEIKFSDIAEEDLFCVLPAICHFMSVLKADLPDTRIIFIANCDIDGCVVDCIKTAGAHFGVEVVELEHIDKQSGHPTSLGMEQICSQVLSRF
ncbi:MAG: hypothetical protein IJX74_07590 [Clostridia bacterium]|nr:hypothetical protein [Clostridia bacterium]